MVLFWGYTGTQVKKRHNKHIWTCTHIKTYLQSALPLQNVSHPIVWGWMPQIKEVCKQVCTQVRKSKGFSILGCSCLYVLRTCPWLVHFPSGVLNMRMHTSIRASFSFLLLLTWAAPAPCLYHYLIVFTCHYLIVISGLLCHPQVFLLLVSCEIVLCEALRCRWILSHLPLHISSPRFLFMTRLRVQQRRFLFWTWLVEFMCSFSANSLPTASSQIVGGGV